MSSPIKVDDEAINKLINLIGWGSDGLCAQVDQLIYGTGAYFDVYQTSAFQRLDAGSSASGVALSATLDSSAKELDKRLKQYSAKLTGLVRALQKFKDKTDETELLNLTKSSDLTKLVPGSPAVPKSS